MIKARSLIVEEPNIRRTFRFRELVSKVIVRKDHPSTLSRDLIRICKYSRVVQKNW